MRIILDTHILLWAAAEPERLPPSARKLLDSPETEPLFSPASIWEVAIKQALGRRDFQIDPRLLRRGLLDNGYVEMPIVSEHAAALADLPMLHKDPFDRILIAQAMCSGVQLMTVDEIVGQYPGPIRRV